MIELELVQAPAGHSRLRLPDGTSSPPLRLPMFGGARWLLEQGWPSGTVVTFRHQGSATLATRPQSLAWLASKSVQGGDARSLHRVPFVPRSAAAPTREPVAAE